MRPRFAERVPDVVLSALVCLASACQGVAATKPIPVTVKPVSTSTAIVPSSTAPIRTPPSLPSVYQSPSLNMADTPHEYIDDSCQYLHDKWGSNKAAPGTVVMVVMLHSITHGQVESGDAITVRDFQKMMDEIHQQGFEAIDTSQLLDFLEHNSQIPLRSVFLMQDSRRYADNFNVHFRPYWEQWGWPVVNAWDSTGNTTGTLWAENIALEKEGFVDHQAYGISLNANMDRLSEEYFADELGKNLPAFQEHFGKIPAALVWPSGLSINAVHAARQVGYRLGFTPNARGPLMYDWIPLADQRDPSRPSLVAEGPMEDPLMTLPRYWPYQVEKALDPVRVIGKQAADYADENKATELEYYDVVCAAKYGPMP